MMKWGDVPARQWGARLGIKAVRRDREMVPVGYSEG